MSITDVPINPTHWTFLNCRNCWVFFRFGVLSQHWLPSNVAVAACEKTLNTVAVGNMLTSLMWRLSKMLHWHFPSVHYAPYQIAQTINKPSRIHVLITYKLQISNYGMRGDYVGCLQLLCIIADFVGGSHKDISSRPPFITDWAYCLILEPLVSAPAIACVCFHSKHMMIVKCLRSDYHYSIRRILCSNIWSTTSQRGEMSPQSLRSDSGAEREMSDRRIEMHISIREGRSLIIYG